MTIKATEVDDLETWTAEALYLKFSGAETPPVMKKVEAEVVRRVSLPTVTDRDLDLLRSVGETIAMLRVNGL